MQTTQHARADGLTNAGTIIPRDAQRLVLKEVGIDQQTNRRILLRMFDDHLPYKHVEAVAKRFWGGGRYGIEEWAKRASDADLTKFGEAILKQKLTGFRIIRDTNVSKGHPVYAFEGMPKK